MTPEIQYTRSWPDVDIAYQVFGEGPNDIVLVPGWISNLETAWEEPTFVRFLQGLGELGRVIVFDKRGTGLSDRATLGASLEERMDDVRAVMDAVGSQKATIFGYSEGGTMSVLFSTTYPERTNGLVLMGSYARRAAAPDYPFGTSVAEQQKTLDDVEENWGTSYMGLEGRINSKLNDARFTKWWAKFLRTSASRAGAKEIMRMNFEIDVRKILPAVTVPALIIQARGDELIPMPHAEYLAANIPNARLSVIDADDHVPFGDGMELVHDEIRQFIGSDSGNGQQDRVLKTIMFTDIVGSTSKASDMGDSDWRDLLSAHHGLVRQQLAIHRGEEVKTTGDGFHANFDGPARAIKCARAVSEVVSEIGLDVRVGLHTGECVRRGNSLEGQAIHIAARVCAVAEAGEVLVSRTVRDLVAGSGIETVPHGTHTLAGIDGDWELLRVV